MTGIAVVVGLIVQCHRITIGSFDDPFSILYHVQNILLFDLIPLYSIFPQIPSWTTYSVYSDSQLIFTRAVVISITDPRNRRVHWILAL